MLSDLLTWWLQQMTALLPSGMFGDARYRDAVIVRVQGAGLVASLRRRGAETLLGPLEPGGSVARRLRGRGAGPVVISLPATALLQQSATLPLAAERDLGAVLSHEMDRLTPFAASDLYWSYRVESRDRAGGRLLLRLLLIPRLAVAAGLEALAAAGLRAVAIEVASGSIVEHLRLQQPGTRRRSVAVAGWVCATLAVALAVLPVVRQQQAIGQAEERVAALRPQVAVVDALRRRVAANESGATLFTAEAARVGSPLRALAAVTTALPDDTFLTGFTMRDRKLSLSGRSAAAARLIGLLSADPDLQDPAFDAPVTRAGDRLDLFSIRATFAP